MKQFQVGFLILPLLVSLNLVSGKVEEVGKKEVDELRKANKELIEKYNADDIANKTPVELIKLRGFEAEEHFAHTKDGYHINVVRIIHPSIDRKLLKRPVIFNHGLLECSSIWLMNSLGVKPLDCENICDPSFANTSIYSNGPMMLANYGYDVWLMSMRGTEFSLKHDRLDAKDPEFWNYCLDDFALVDVPTVIDYVRNETGASKVGYIGHSQATFAIFALLSARPSYSQVLEPVVAVAPVASFQHITSVLRPLFLSILRTTSVTTHRRFPSQAKALRSTLGQFCKRGFAKLTCYLVKSLISGKGESWPRGYYTHFPHFTSLKVVRHFGLLVREKKFMMYDYGKELNRKIYGKDQSPSYPVDQINSKSLCLISTKTDALSPPEDVDNFKRRLTVPLFRDILIGGEFDHFDLILNPAARDLVFKPILEIFETIEHETGVCSVAVEEEEKSEKEKIVEEVADHTDEETQSNSIEYSSSEEAIEQR